MVRAAGLSLAVHAVVLLALALTPALRRRGVLPVLAVAPTVAAADVASGDPTWVALTPANLVDPVAADPPPEAAPSLAAPASDNAVIDPRPAELRRGLHLSPRALAVDSGAAEGRALPPAFRLDRTTLRARLQDGASAYQVNREAISDRATTPQAARQERITGTGDSVRTRAPRPEPPTPAPLLPDEAAVADEDATTVPSQARAPDRRAPGEDPHRGDGPLDARRGRRSFDQDRAGPAADNVAARAASNEPRPGLIDYTAVSAPGPEAGASGRGPGAEPGAVSSLSAGAAASVQGEPDARALAEAAGAATAEREYARVLQEIRRRFERALRFPKRLALELQQGEAVVQFRVEVDGRLGGEVKLLKSAGFAEFDSEALDLVRRTAPFPPLRRAVVVRMPVTFENPLIR